jgi:DNA invertase Pin-like site-specific DNA recombinase
VDAVAYVRASSKAQTHHTQRAAIERTAAARDDAVADWYSGKRSAKTMARDELQGGVGGTFFVDP